MFFCQFLDLCLSFLPQLRIAKEAFTLIPEAQAKPKLHVEHAVHISRRLDQLGYRSSRVGDAAMALDVLEAGETEVDLLLSDMVMPGEMGGLDLARAVRQMRGDMPIVLMTGYSDAAAAAAAEGIDLLVKPYTMEALGNALDSAIAGSVAA